MSTQILYEVCDSSWDGCECVYFTTEVEALRFCEAERIRAGHQEDYKRLPMGKPEVTQIEVFTTATEAEEKLGATKSFETYSG